MVKDNSVRFLVFEGLDGSGKSTLIHKLAEYLKTLNQEAVLTREPGGTPLGDKIRKLLLDTHSDAPIPIAELFLYEAARAQHVENFIRPALQKGSWVLCDRFAASTISFQAYARGLSRKDIEFLNDIATSRLLPDLYILLDLPVDISLSRLQQRGEGLDRFENEKLAFHEKVRQGYLQQVKQQPELWLQLDALQTPDQLFSLLQRELTRRKWL